MSDWLSHLYRQRHGYEFVKELADGTPRLAGTDGEREAARRIVRACESKGRKPTRQEFKLQGWESEEANVVTQDGAIVECLALPRSPNTTASGPLVDLGQGLPADFAETNVDGAVVLVTDGGQANGRPIHRGEKYARAVRNGASGFLFQNTADGDIIRTGCIGSPKAPVGDIPAVGISKESGRKLTRITEREITVSVSAKLGSTTSQNVHVAFGPATDREMLVVAHYDAHDIGDGAIDNASGVGVLVELAGVLPTVDLQKRVRLVATGAEEVGYQGAEAYASNTDSDSIAAVVNVDSVGFGNPLQLLTHGWPEFEAAGEKVASALGHQISITADQQPYSDHWPFLQRGIPAMAITCTPPDNRAWGHTAADTVDKVDRATFVDHAAFITEFVIRLATEEWTFPHRDQAEVATALEQDNVAKGLRATGNWPFEGP